MTEVEYWACAFVVRVDPGFGELSDNDKLVENLFTSGRLDSMALMNMLLDAETAFDFTFTPEAFQDRRIQTITGLSAVVEELRESA